MSGTSALLGVTDQIQHAAVLLARQSDQVLQEQLGIGLSQFRILQAIQKQPMIGQIHIARLLGQTEASVSRQIKLMQGRGMVTVRTNPRNRREHTADLTPKGERLLEAGGRVLARYHAPAVGRLSAKEQRALLELVGKLQAGL